MEVKVEMVDGQLLGMIRSIVKHNIRRLTEIEFVSHTQVLVKLSFAAYH